MAMSIAMAADKKKAIEGFVPEQYKGQFDTAVKTYDKAVELKKQKDELQIQIFEKAIDPLWKQYDKDDKGHISQEQFKELGKLALEKAGHGDKFNEMIFDEACK